MSIIHYARKTLAGPFHFLDTDGVRFKSQSPRIQLKGGLLPTVAVACGAALIIAVAAHQTPLGGTQEVALLRHAAERGDTGAQIQLGLAYREGRFGLARNEMEGSAWIHRAAQTGDRYAVKLESATPVKGPAGAAQGLHEFTRIVGQGGLVDHSTGQLTQQAENGDSLAQYQLAMRYRDGSWGVSTDSEQARFWLLRAAEGGNRVAMRTLASAYEQGALGLPQNEAKADTWRARAQGLAETDSGR